MLNPVPYLTPKTALDSKPHLNNNPEFEISKIIDQMAKVNKVLLINDGDPNMYTTMIPYLYNLYSDLVLNPSSISVSEFQKMATRIPVISFGLAMLRNLIKNRFKTYSHPKKEIQDFINEMLYKMDTPLSSVLDDMCTALWSGFYVGEKKYVSDGRYWYVQNIAPTPPSSIIFRVDSQGNVKEDGIIQYYFNNLWTGYGNMLAFDGIAPNGETIPNPFASRGDFNYPIRAVWAQPIGTVVIPKGKTIHYVSKLNTGMGNPYGISLLNPMYDSYLIKTKLNPIMLNAALFKASKIPFITVDPNQMTTDEGQEAFDNLEWALRNLSAGEEGGNPAVLMKGTKDSIQIDGLDSTANLDQFINLSQYEDNQMLMALLLQSDLMGTSDKGSYALGETQADLVGRNIDALAQSIKDCLIEQLIKPILKLNWNETEEFGSFGNADDVAEDVALNLDKLNALRLEGIKLKPEAIVRMMDISEDDIEATNVPVMDLTDNRMANSGMNSNYKRAGGKVG